MQTACIKNFTAVAVTYLLHVACLCILLECLPFSSIYGAAAGPKQPVFHKKGQVDKDGHTDEDDREGSDKDDDYDVDQALVGTRGRATAKVYNEHQVADSGKKASKVGNKQTQKPSKGKVLHLVTMKSCLCVIFIPQPKIIL